MNKKRSFAAMLVCLMGISIGKSQTQKLKDVASGPDNVACMEGDQVILLCESTGGSSRMAWLEYASGNPIGRLLSDGASISATHPNADHYDIIHNDSNSFHLFINSTVMEDAGRYRCMDQENPVDESISAELIIIKNDPVCVSPLGASGEVIDGHEYSVTCSVDYKGNIAPTMTWSGPQLFTSETSSTNTTVSSTLTFTASRAMNGMLYSCRTYFAAEDFDNLPELYATNVPPYEDVYKGATLAVYYCSASGPSITLMQESDGSDGAFNRSWADFKAGFSSPNILWLGNDAINTLTKDGNCKVRLDLQSKSDGLWYSAEYSTFIVGNESTGYQLTVDGYSGNTTDSMVYHNGMKFTTFDQDNDNWSGNCATYQSAGWWFKSCCYACITLPASSNNFHWSSPPGYDLIASRVWLIYN